MPKYIMSDGREFTDYASSCILNNIIQTKYNITNSYDYKHFLQKNSEQIMKELRECDKSKSCPVCKKKLSI